MTDPFHRGHLSSRTRISGTDAATRDIVKWSWLKMKNPEYGFG